MRINKLKKFNVLSIDIRFLCERCLKGTTSCSSRILVVFFQMSEKGETKMINFMNMKVKEMLICDETWKKRKKEHRQRRDKYC